MFDLEEISKQIEDFKKRITDIGDSLCINHLEEEWKKLERETTKQDFWNDSENMAKVLPRINNLKKKKFVMTIIENEKLLICIIFIYFVDIWEFFIYIIYLYWSF